MADPNPYAPPAGLYLLSQNRRRLGRAASATSTLLAGLGLTVALFGLAFLLPGNTGFMAGLAATIGVGQYAKQDAYLLDEHLGRGGKKEPGWKAAAVGLLGLVLLSGAVFGVLVLFF